MAGIEPVKYKGIDVIPLEFLKAVLPDPGDLGENYTGQTSIGCRIKGIKDGQERTYYIWNNCQHQDAYKETGTQGVSYTTGVPAMLGAKMFLEGHWGGAGVFNVEDFNPDPFLAHLGIAGLPWHEEVDGDLEFEY
jgi:saccharopine dehydrogenase (NAD+, L-lysine-forming)